MSKTLTASITLCIGAVILCAATYNKVKSPDNEKSKSFDAVNSPVANQKNFSPALPIDSMVNFSLCRDSGAYDLPNSIALPLAQTIPGYRNNDSLIAFLQDRFDFFSWKTFIALNWPSLPTGMPDTHACFSQNTHSTVWEHWMPSSRIYVNKGKTPTPWKDGEYSPTQYFSNHKGLHTRIKHVPEHVHPLNSGTYSTMKISKVDSQFTIFDADQYPVVDKHHMYTLFEIFYNHAAYDYVVKSKLYSKEGQQQFVENWPSKTSGLAMVINKDTVNIERQFKRAYFPVGNVKDSSKSYGDTTFFFTKNPGAIIIKSAWIVLTSKSEYDKYFTRTIKVKDKTGLKTRVLGLVAMHFIHKVAEVTQWVWSSFEHIHNAPNIGPNGKAILEKGVDYLYFDEQNKDTSLYNKHFKGKYQPNPFKRRPTQVVNVMPSLKSTDHVNNLFHALIAKEDKHSVWLHYRLIGTQWVFNPTLFQFGSSYRPKMMSNALMETYAQRESSCLGCHKESRFLSQGNAANFNYGYNGDFVFGLSEAQ
jgi:hypothetical protein